MRSSKTTPCRTLFQLLAFMSGFQHGHALTQSYCSSENTGSDYSTVSNIYQSNGACQTECAANYAYAVVQYQSCWCSNYTPADQTDVSDCSTACPGYPDESCGNSDDGLYGYIALDKTPSGTAGGSSSAASSTSSSQAATSSSSSTEQQSTSSAPESSSSETSTSEPSDSTVYSSIPVTVYSTVKEDPSVVVSYVTLSSSAESSTTTSPSPTSSSTTPTSTSFSTTSTFPSITSTTALAAATTSSDESFTPTTLVSTRVLTVSGAPVTQTVTSTPMVVNPAADSQQPQRKSVSSGTIAGAVVGSLVGLALLALGVFFLWRRKRSDASSDARSSTSSSARRKMERNTSVLSKTGLLSSAGATHDVEKSYDGAGLVNTGSNKRNSAMYSSQVPISPVDDSSQRSRRNSRPLVYDQRLNPNAIMSNWEANGSRASVGTMQDQRDYSRPLNVTNPDPVGD